MSDTTMTKSERESFLAGVHIGVLSIPTGDAPLTAPIWYDYQPGGEIQVLLGRNSLKGQLLSEGTRVTMVAQQEALPYAYVSVEGTVSAMVAATAEDTLNMAIRFLGEEMGTGYAESNASNDSLRVQIRPDRWRTVDYAKSG